MIVRPTAQALAFACLFVVNWMLAPPLLNSHANELKPEQQNNSLKSISLLLRLGQYQSALQRLSQRENHLSTNDKLLLLAKINLGLANLDKAFKFFKDYLADDGVKNTAFLGLGMVEAKRGQIRKALAMFDQAIEADSSSYESYVNRGISHAALGNTSKAISDFTEAIRINPLGADAYRNRGIILEINGDLSTACSDWVAAKTLGQDDPGRWIELHCKNSAKQL